ncbi:TPA: ribosome-associated translation inhibitor RaiA [Candidatus Dependentiae bacterium]|nr:MAG: SSU ribosomal protein S30P,sigma 54 modulation protein [candidate division TM6 bacterium GW2011_GWF2_36_131]KKQ03005.1 MAG: SSU ribosomal protein S30P,sigma 54 modulation protein [candidate division TM6 bacterium GW2011_GWE2_36_25]KKQ19562.1 MAG: SSU ribosomal protein S30P,sigma 54 modulation protein [candidate division TM6 bacterium GW2011_GWA2_36_9]HBR71076.1 ribosome-associated translation inhibitor RaiA [Candidatus Dependentiae bacterium]HCU01028.1 ribosome-associated translation in
MEIQITFRNMESSPTIEKYINEKVEKLDRFLKKERLPKKLEIILEAERVHQQHDVELRLHCATYHERAQVSGKDLYAQIDAVFDVLIKEINKKKGKRLVERKEPDPYREPR